MNSGNNKLAISTLKKINNKKSSRCYQTIYMEAIAQSMSQRHELAINLFMSLFLLHLTNAQKLATWSNLSKVQREMKKFNDSIASLKASLKIDDSINNALAQVHLCQLYQEIGDGDKLRQQVTKLKDWPKFYTQALVHLALYYKGQPDLPRLAVMAREYFDYIVLLEDHMIEGQMVDLSVDILIITNQVELATSLLEKVEQKSGTPTWLNFYKAVVHNYKKEYVQVTKLLPDITIKAMPEWLKKDRVYQLLATAHDKLKQFDKAFFTILKLLKLLSNYIKT